MTKTLPTVALLAAFLAASHAEAAFTRQPWIQDATKDSVTIAWEAGAGGGAQTLSYGAPTPDQTVEATLVSGTLYKATVTGLSPSSRFQYKVTSGADESVQGSFVTAPAVAEPFRFGVSGDNRSDSAAHASVVAATIPFAPDFMLNTGDIVDGTDYTEFFDVEAELLRNAAIFPSPGNHDSASLYQYGFDRPSYYAFRWGNAMFFSVNTDMDHSTGSTQVQWLEQQLQAAQQDESIDWKFVFHHHPVYSSGSHGNTQSVIDSLNPLYKQYGVDVVFNGHDHNYERVELDGIVYIVTGGGGVSPRSMGSPVDGQKYAESVRHVTIADVDGGVLKIRAYRPDGSELDAVDVVKGPTSGGEEPGPGPGPGGGNPTNPGDAMDTIHGGCGCSTTASSPSLAGALLALGAVLAARRRRA